MTARSIDGKTIAADLRGKVTDAVHRLRRDRGLVPGIAVVLVGENAASEVYVRNKSKAVNEAGMHPSDRKLPATACEAELLDLVMAASFYGYASRLTLALDVRVDPGMPTIAAS